MKEIIFIGAINVNCKPNGGQDAKNQQILNYLDRQGVGYKCIDTFNWKSKIVSLLISFLKIALFTRNKDIYLSINDSNAYYLLKFFSFFNLFKSNKIYLFVVGGELQDFINENKERAKYFEKLIMIFPESKEMEVELNKIGLNNVRQIPNMRLIPSISIERNYEVLKFVFISRLIPEKGTDLIIAAAKKLNNLGLEKQFTVSFYGMFDGADKTGYKNKFNKEIELVSNIDCKGFIDLSSEKGYIEVSKYNSMVFPTCWKGEGYPGVLIDAMISNLPVIASDWNFNKEIIINDFNGVLINPNSVESLVDSMKGLINNPVILKKYEKGCSELVNKYNIDILLKEVFLSN